MNGNVLISLLAQGTAPDPRAQTLQFAGMLGIMIVMFYFAIYRPQKNKAKEHDALMKALKAGDRVVTNSGIIGTVVSIKDKTVTMRSADTKLEVLKSAVNEVIVETKSDSGSSS